MALGKGMSRAKKALIVAAVVLGGTLIAAVALWWSTFGIAESLPKTATLGDGAGHIMVNEGYVASYIVPVGGGHAIIVDCGLAEDGHVVKEALAKASLTLDAALVTHGHPDHIGGCNALGVPVTALAAEVPGLWGDEPFYAGPVPKMAGPSKLHVKVASSVEDGVTMTYGSDHKEVRVFAVPGHTKGSAAYLVDGVLYFGDAAGQAKGGDGVLGPPGIFSDDVDQGVASLKALAGKLRALPPAAQPKTFAFAHSAPMPADLAKLEDPQ